MLNNTVLNNLNEIRSRAAIQNQDPTASLVWVRIESLAEEALAAIEQEPKTKSRISTLRPGTDAFDAYCFQKINCSRDIVRIAQRHNISETDVLESYNRGRDY